MRVRPPPLGLRDADSREESNPAVGTRLARDWGVHASDPEHTLDRGRCRVACDECNPHDAVVAIELGTQVGVLDAER